MKERIKTFTNVVQDSLDDAVNGWLEETKAKIVTITHAQGAGTAESESVLSVVILFIPKE